MRRILSQILFAVFTAALLLCGYFAAPLLGTRLAAPSLSGEKETGATGAEIAAASPAGPPPITITSYSFILFSPSISSNFYRFS